MTKSPAKQSSAAMPSLGPNGRAVGLDVHPDTFAAAIMIHSLRSDSKLSCKFGHANLTIEQLNRRLGAGVETLPFKDGDRKRRNPSMKRREGMGHDPVGDEQSVTAIFSRLSVVNKCQATGKAFDSM